jgi:nucleotide-binding universal stress UspA family protein
MYKHILIATDGSEIAHGAISHGIELAKKIGAKLSAVTVTERYEAPMELEAPVMILQADYDKRCSAFATKILSVVTSAAEAVGIKCDALYQQKSMAI